MKTPPFEKGGSSSKTSAFGRKRAVSNTGNPSRLLGTTKGCEKEMDSKRQAASTLEVQSERK